MNLLQEKLIIATVSVDTWEGIFCYCEAYNVEANTHKDYMFDTRVSAINIWGRDGWKKGYIHCTIYIEKKKDWIIIMYEEGTFPIKGHGKRVNWSFSYTKKFWNEYLVSRAKNFLEHSQ